MVRVADRITCQKHRPTVAILIDCEIGCNFSGHEKAAHGSLALSPTMPQWILRMAAVTSRKTRTASIGSETQ